MPTFDELQGREMDAVKAEVRRAAIEQCVGVLLGERGRLLKLQQKEFGGARDAQIRILYSMAARLRKLK